MLLAVCKRAAEHGLLVWLVAHSRDRLWYSRSISEETTMDSWTALARQLCAQWNVVAADLKNKPGAASWGLGINSDWDAAAKRLGDHVLGKCKRWLIVVEGVGQTPGADQDAEMEFTAMHHDFLDGENLVGVSTHPVALKDSSKLVYGAHTYGPGYKMLPYMRDDEYPEITEQVWQEHFLYLRRLDATVVVNLGGPYESSVRDTLFQDWAVRFCARNGISVFYDGLNPLAGLGGSPPGEVADQPGVSPSTLGNNTGGLLKPDWMDPWNAKLTLLSQLPVTRVSALLQSIPFNGIVRPPPPPPPFEGDYPEWLRPSPPPSPPPPPPPTLQCGPGCASGMMLAFVLVPIVALRIGLIRQQTARRVLHGFPQPLKGLLGALCGVDLSISPLNVSPHARDVGREEDADADADADAEPQPQKHGKTKSKKKEKKKLLLMDQSQPAPQCDGSVIDDADDAEVSERHPLKQKPPRKSSRRDHGEARPSRRHDDQEPKSDRQRTGKHSRETRSCSEPEELPPAPKSKGRGKSSKGGEAADHNADDIEPAGVSASRKNQFKRFADEEDEGRQRARRIAPVD